jgi:two-component system, NtrC family, sensor kinase
MGLWRRNIYRKNHVLLQKQKQEIDDQKTKVEKTLDELKSIQSQLIQSEKMASLGVLIAGIAHEI